jgi:uncharacterized repeat protein (TIGR01451 family)
VYSDPVNGTINPKNIPGSEVLYTLIVTNSGAGTVDNNTLVIVDPIPANTELFTGNLSGGAPLVFTNGAPSSGLTCTFTALNNFADCVDFSNNGGATWNYVPNGGFDPAVTHIRFIPAGAMNGDAVAGSPSPNFSLQPHQLVARICFVKNHEPPLHIRSSVSCPARPRAGPATGCRFSRHPVRGHALRFRPGLHGQ